MNQNFKRSAQSGFTLIELIVVIVILGILAATALPKFASLAGDARVASLGAARGSLNSVAAMSHGKYLISNTAAISMEGTTLAMTTAGYPKADANTIAAAGLGAGDYTVAYGSATATTPATASVPAIPANSMVIIPKGPAGTAAGLSCYLTYTESSTVGTMPSVALAATATADNC